MSVHRDRATGWQYAKLSGHTNEERVKDLMDSDLNFQQSLLKRIDADGSINVCDIGGLHEKNVPGVLGASTKSKTDLKIYLDNGKQVNISVKKSLAGQVYFVRVEHFLDVFEYQFKTTIPDNVKRAMRLFWAAADDAISIIRKLSDPCNLLQQLRHRSLNAETLKKYDIKLYNEMLLWFKNHAYELTLLSFSKGAVKSSDEWAKYVWYINTLGENNIDDIFLIEDIANAAKFNCEALTSYGDKNGGTTIQLPFGFVQWHQAQMQFHHQYEKVKYLTSL